VVLLLLVVVAVRLDFLVGAANLLHLLVVVVAEDAQVPLPCEVGWLEVSGMHFSISGQSLEP
jgi:hypothetical protein